MTILCLNEVINVIYLNNVSIIFLVVRDTITYRIVVERAGINNVTLKNLLRIEGFMCSFTLKI